MSFSLRSDRTALSEQETAACLTIGRRPVNEGLAAPAHRDAHGRSRARLIDSRP